MRTAIGLLGAFAVLLVLADGSARSADDTKSFFNGKNLDGWEGLIKEYWSVKDGAIVGSTLPKGINFNTFLCSKKKYKDFELKFKIRLKDGAGNSGVQIRSRIHDPKKFAVTGPQCDIGAGYWGSLYGENFGGMMKAAPPGVVRRTSSRRTSTTTTSSASASTSPSRSTARPRSTTTSRRCRTRASSPGSCTPAAAWK